MLFERRPKASSSTRHISPLQVSLKYHFNTQYLIAVAIHIVSDIDFQNLYLVEVAT